MNVKNIINKIVSYACHPSHSLEVIYLKNRWLINRFRGLFTEKKVYDLKRIPIIINNFNQLTYLKKLIESLEKRGYKNIYIIDNASSYPPLLEYYDECKYTVFRLKENIGFKALWSTDIFDRFKHSYYVYTDPDVVPIDDCPADFIEYFYGILQKFKKTQKVGFSLKIDDLPDCFREKEKVVNWEQNFWKKEIDVNLYDAPIDTTFALYRPYAKGSANFVELNIRTGYPYQARHLPWYTDTANPTEEQKYYIEHCKKITHWTAKMKK